MIAAGPAGRLRSGGKGSKNRFNGLCYLRFQRTTPSLLSSRMIPLIGQVLTNMIGFGEIALVTRRLSRRHELFNLRIALARSHGPPCRSSPALLIIIVLKNGKNGVKGIQSPSHRRYIALPEIVAIHGNIGFADQIEDRR